MSGQSKRTEGEHRAQAILAVLSGQQSVAEAADVLGLSQQRIYQLCEKAKAALGVACEPGQPGRPTKEPPHPDTVRVRELENKNAELEFELEAERLRSELGLILPHVLEPDPKPKPLKRGRRRQRKTGRDG